ncbi:hypothetical protein THASP1DRAFT_35380 [Thamnocephalis sphaerospora]|uniref:PCI domain-containing protein n=1 Tax=Thamnocephalis sphaerospora TaxID=78915 RepID=A0A4P9XHS7_9FUNG|nr:hypothetical protein THASP1DRAFT_35380 [Thamnocephalis sphaerospora]|eukprot:RKP05177.1 hypothetical protein THASP1DRAFT_35380 [Thamnocephalis sphaerospora]
MTTRLERYLTQLQTQIARSNGEKLQERLRLDDTHTAKLAADVDGNEDHCARLCRSKLKEPWSELAERHILASLAHRRGDAVSTFDHQLAATKVFLRLLPTCNRWVLPVMYAILRDLRKVAGQGDAAVVARGEKAHMLEEAARTINQAFSLCVMDRTSGLQQSRKWGTYFVIGLLFGTYFKLRSQNLCKNILRAVSASASDLPPLERYPKSHQVAFRYYQGVLAFREEKYAKAETELALALRHCKRDAATHKERILKFLIPLRLLRGILPSRQLLQQYPRIAAVYAPFIDAVRTGNVKSFDVAILEHEQLLARMGTYLTLERARHMAVRTLFRRTYIIGGKDPKMPMEKFQIALRMAGVDATMPEVECLLANMIYKGYMRGYLSHERSYVVLSSKGPFPTVELAAA